MDEKQDQILKECSEKLGEHFEAALILVCHKNHDDFGNMTMTHRSRGNYFASIGMAHSFVEMQQADKTGYSVKEALDQ